MPGSFPRGPLAPEKFFKASQYPPPPIFSQPYFISGITRDEAGAIRGNAYCKLFRTSDDKVLATTFSDQTTGFYFFPADNVTACYVVSRWGGAGDFSYGSPPYGSGAGSGVVVGITDNALIGS